MKTLTLIVPIETGAQSTAAETLQALLFEHAGGFSRYEGFGAWRDETGRVYKERHARLEVSFNRAEVRLYVLAAFVAYGLAAGEQALAYLEAGALTIQTPEAIEASLSSRAVA